MKKSTVKKLNQINREFYHQTAEEFSRSRSYYWSGWKKILPHLNTITAQKKEINVLDVGCGNGRFGLFLSANSSEIKINYWGIDFSERLLASAEKRLAAAKINYHLKKTDITEGLNLKPLKFDLIVCFGLFHHLPSFYLRQKLLKDLADRLNVNGLLAVTFWQFADKPRFKQKIVQPEKVGIQPKEIDDKDYILDWKRGKKAYRYCRQIDYPEAEKLSQGLNLKQIDQYLADGKTSDLNLYLVFKKT